MFLPGDVIASRYRLVRCIGRGGQGEVWLAAQDKLFGRRAAVKFMLVLPAHEDGMKARFVGEATVLARLDHRAICPILDFGELSVGDDHTTVLYLVMAFVDGFDLSNLVRTGGIHPGLALHVVSEMLQGLKHAHEHGVIHRDIKPQNVLVSRVGDIKLTDFGIAKTVAPGRNPSISTATIGTPGYMAIEILKGLAATFQSDIFSVGAVLYDLLVGHSPFVRPGASREEIFYATLNEPVPSLASLGIAVPPAVEWMVQRALAKDPSARYGSATEFLEELLPILGSYGSEGNALAWTRFLAAETQTIVAPPALASIEGEGEGAAPSSIGISRMAGQVARPTGQPPAETSEARPRRRVRRFVIGATVAAVVTTGAGFLLLGPGNAAIDVRSASPAVPSTPITAAIDAGSAMAASAVPDAAPPAVDLVANTPNAPDAGAQSASPGPKRPAGHSVRRGAEGTPAQVPRPTPTKPPSNQPSPAPTDKEGTLKI